MTVEILEPPVWDPEAEHRQGEFFRPNSWAQQRFLISDTPELLYSGSLGSAKTRSLAEKGAKRCAKFAGSRTVVGRRYRAHLGGSTLAMLREKVITPAHWAWGWRSAADGGSTLFWPNGSEMWFVGFDNPQRLLSSEVDMVLIDECVELNEEQWDSAADRLRRQVYDDDGNTAPTQIAGATNPASPAHFLYQRFRPNLGSHIEWTLEPVRLRTGHVMPANTAWAECVCSSPMDNVANLPPRYLAQLERRHGRYYERMVLGKWVNYEGAVYDCFDQDHHVVRRPRFWDEWGGFPPPDWQRARGIDYGYHPDPFVCIWLARSPGGTWFVYRQIYKTRTLVSAHTKRIMELEDEELRALNRRLREKGEQELRWLPMMGTFGDHDNQARKTMDYESGGQIIVERARKEINPGIETVYGLLQPVTGPDGIKRSRMYVVDRRWSLVEVDEERAEAKLPLCLEDELFAYKYAEQPADRDKPSKDEPLDQHNHACDAVRYPVHTIRMRQGWI